MQDIGMLLWQGLGPYIHNSQYVPPFVQVDSSIPILLCEHIGQEPSEKKKEVNLHVKMPDLELPTFNGKLESWLSFEDLFFSAIGSNSQIPDIEKL
ncbi:hypothetical protein LAZ67_9002454 [Cordylochernes scorpioides]|uniref:Uncharacterized protein n=1 Tax=Cordylochernes scorpioides TaxID=51811 RepID=A0ABY6KTU2_9ARAC|nr:hypothetical protein LAZ67_9002454 [Cordylochernes scorpioides]